MPDNQFLGPDLAAATLDKPSDDKPNDDFAGRTIVGLPLERPRKMTALVLDQPEAPGVTVMSASEQTFKIRMADDEGHRSSASMLINKMYAWRGYGSSVALPAANPHRITLVASTGRITLGTLTLGLDQDIGLLADEVYGPEVDAVRKTGAKVCELSKLAVDQQAGSKRVLAALFHISYVYGRLMHHVTDVFIEVNPRHVAFYRRMLGFEVAGEQRVCPRVGAPAVLLRLPLSHVDRMIEEFGGRADLSAEERSLYPYFFSKKEENGIAVRLRLVG